jgi:hypothetical protein
MKKNRFVFFYALSLYSLLSTVLMSAQFFAAGLLVYLLFQTVHLPVFGGLTCFFRTSFYDSAGFAFLTASNTILQYYLASLLARDLKGRSALFGILTLSAIISALFFIRLSARSAFGAYTFAYMPLIFSYLLGGVAGLLQKETDNPFRDSRIRLFSLDY